MLKDNIAFHYWILLCVFFFFKTLINSMMQGYGRFKANKFHNPEDTERFADPNKAVSEKYAALDERAGRCWRNDLENIPFFLILSLGFVLLGASPTA